MKIRYGFVSNSSSTSFAVTVNDYPTVRDLAIGMMEIRNGDWDSFDDEEVADLTLKHAKTGDEGTYEQIEKALAVPTANQIELEVLINSELDKDTPTAFKTTNYPTYIMKSGHYLFVSTSNNHYWHDYRPKCALDRNLIVPKDFKEMLPEKDYKKLLSGELELADYIEFYLEYATTFWWPKVNKMVKQFRDEESDMCCNHDFRENKVLVDGKLMCPVCDLKLGWL